MVGFFDSELGRVQISHSIVRNLIMREVQSNKNFGLPGGKTGEPTSRKTLERCIRANFVDGSIEASLMVTVIYGAKIIKEARELQGKIVRALELRAGLRVNTVTIKVENVFTEESSLPLLLQDKTVQASA